MPPLASHGAISVTENELIEWGEKLGASARAPTVLALSGDLGSGKTTLAKAICRGYGVTAEVTSPTYALVHQYEAARSSVYHIDLYRLQNPKELTNIGWDEIVGGHSLIIVEWPAIAGERLPRDHVPIALAYEEGNPDHRILLAG